MNRTLRATVLMLLPSFAWPDVSISVPLPECSSKLERRDAESQVLIVRSGCHLSLASLSRLLETGFGQLFPDHSLPVHGIYLGRLMDYPDWSKALAKAAAKSRTWNNKRGRPVKRSENDNHRVRLLLNGEVFPEALNSVFEPYGLKPCIGPVEKVLVFEARDIFTGEGEMPKRLSPRARLPADGQIWLDLQPKGTSCRAE